MNRPFYGKKRPSVEIYEEYWKITAAWTDIFKSKFSNNLNLVLTYIDNNEAALLEWRRYHDNFKGTDLYSNLQEKIIQANGFKGNDGGTSARKGINTFIKLGFVKPFLTGYHPKARKFLKCTDKETKRLIFSEIFYNNASFGSEVTKDLTGQNNIKFLLNTLNANGKLSLEELAGLVVTDITQYPNGYLLPRELQEQAAYAMANDFADRKYNQLSHLKSFLCKFVDLCFDKAKEEFYFASDIDVSEIDKKTVKKRDPLLHRFYRYKLKLESERIYGKMVCYLEKVEYKGLVASHIKPCAVCLDERVDEQAYDENNGLLLSPNLDAYFDKFDITFDPEGKPLFSDRVPENIVNMYKDMKLDSEILNACRQKYLEYHRKRFDERNR